MQILPNNELDNICLSLIQSAKGLKFKTSDLFLLLYRTGLRCNEILEAERWSVLDDDFFQIQLSKSKAIRKINRSLVPNSLAVHYFSARPFLIENHNHLNHFVRKSIKPIKTITKENCRTTHLFRYNFCRKLIDQGKTLEDVKSVICHKSQLVTERYCYSPLFR